MELKLIANIATIIGSLSIFLILIFVGYELKENVYQSKLANQSNRDMLHSEWLHFWSSKENAALVIKGREDFNSLSKSEKFQFEQFIEHRTRLFGSANSIANKDGSKILRARAKDFFKYPGSMACYQSLKEKELIAIPWMNFIDDALES
tara:strand:- start:1054 stop:1500 length:447 start_codon:yes stop_codon:yes gene_type:complete